MCVEIQLACSYTKNTENLDWNAYQNHLNYVFLYTFATPIFHKSKLHHSHFINKFTFSHTQHASMVSSSCKSEGVSL